MSTQHIGRLCMNDRYEQVHYEYVDRQKNNPCSLTQFFVKSLQRTDLKAKYGSILPQFPISNRLALKTERVHSLIP